MHWNVFTASWAQAEELLRESFHNYNAQDSTSAPSDNETEKDGGHVHILKRKIHVLLVRKSSCLKFSLKH